MALRDDIYKSVKAALTGDLKEAVTDMDGVSPSTSGYNPVTATSASDPATYKLSGVLYNKKTSYIDSTQSNDALKVKTGDMDYLVLVEDLTTIPQIDDELTVTTQGSINTGTTYLVVNFTVDPSESVIILHIRRKHG
ncbi:hypothetical protein PSH49_20235 [Pseudoalteromonas sp. GABNS16G]|uniref:hypothetical protein n=2 Tax=unclassified Pseudoalteromonas TaxID=194690 RepID=UPI0023596DDF|nr:hypothetical protein [Pseudoalteromonas sp. GABNS16G]MDC9602922.1 hypothetical protein [Pseudoalteromonas sp. GABNS16G]